MRIEGEREKETESEKDERQGEGKRVTLPEEKGVDEEEIGLEVAYEDAYAMRTSTRQGGAP